MLYTLCEHLQPEISFPVISFSSWFRRLTAMLHAADHIDHTGFIVLSKEDPLSAF